MRFTNPLSKLAEVESSDSTEVSRLALHWQGDVGCRYCDAGLYPIKFEFEFSLGFQSSKRGLDKDLVS